MSRYPVMVEDDEAKAEKLRARKEYLGSRVEVEMNKESEQRDTALVVRLLGEMSEIDKELEEIRQRRIARIKASQFESKQRAYADEERQRWYSEGYHHGFHAGKAAAISEAGEQEELEAKSGMGCWGWVIAIGVVFIIVAIAAGGG